MRLPHAVWLAGVTSNAIVGELVGVPDSERRPALAVFDRDTGKLERRIPGASPLAVGRDFMLWKQRCSLSGDEVTGPCVLHRTELGQGDREERAYFLAPGQVPYGATTLSRDGRYAAFQLGDSQLDSQYDTGHPVPPSRVAVLDLASDELMIVPNLELAPKTFVGLAFAPDNDWLLLAVNEGRHGHLLAWRLGSHRLLRCPGKIPGPLSSAPPLLVMAR